MSGDEATVTIAGREVTAGVTELRCLCGRDHVVVGFSAPFSSSPAPCLVIECAHQPSGEPPAVFPSQWEPKGHTFYIERRPALVVLAQ